MRIVRYLTPPFGMYTALDAQLNGSLRHTHSRLVEFAEEIAFMNGEETEKMLVEREYAGVLKHANRVLDRRWWFGCVEEGIIKWLWGSFGVSRALAFLDVDILNSRRSLYFALFQSFSSSLVWVILTWEVARKVWHCFEQD